MDRAYRSLLNIQLWWLMLSLGKPHNLRPGAEIFRGPDFFTFAWSGGQLAF